MGGKRTMNCLTCSLALFLLIYFTPISQAFTVTDDVAAINSLYAAMGSPPLPGWVSAAGDPCGEAWQGVQCGVNGNIDSITLNGANLGGALSDSIASFSAITSLDLSNNLIGGSVPATLPGTIQFLFLSDNNFTGSIPSSLSSLSGLSAMSLNNNQLTGEIPNSFQGLMRLANLDLSSNSLTGQLPASLEGLSSLTTLHLQNNQLSGTLDVLQDLPLTELNIENNLFNGPIPDKLLNIPNFKNDGNSFNTSTSPLPSPGNSTSPAPPFFVAPSPRQTPGKQVPDKQRPKGQNGGPSTTGEESSKSSNKSLTTKKIVWISIAAVLGFVVLLLVLVLFMPKCFRRRRDNGLISKSHEITPYVGLGRQNPRDNGSLVQPVDNIDKVSNVAVVKPKEEEQEQETRPRRQGFNLKPSNEQEKNVQRMSAIPKKDDHKIDLSRFDIDSLRPPPPPSPLPPPPPPLPFELPFEKVIVRPKEPTETSSVKPATKPRLPPTSVKSYTIAYLQQHTNSFSQENLVGTGMLGSVYRAELPDGKLLAIKKLDKKVASHQKDDEFIELVNSLDKIRHANVVELMGYCSEHGQRLLIYEFCSSGTLQDALHSDDEYKKKFSWNTRIRMALGAARALEYLHGYCEPAIIHRNFKSVNLLLDDDLTIHVSDCGLAPLISSGSVSQLSGQLLTTYGYGAPEFESGIYTSMSDVYSFGVVMLELLTGRMSYDRTRQRGEQILVRWAIPQLHDIDALSRMVDSSLNGQYPVKSLSNFADIISRCVQTEPEFRPPMSEVVQDLIQLMKRESSSRSDRD